MPRVNGSVVNPAQWDLDENNPVDGADMLQGRTGVRPATGDDLPVGATRWVARLTGKATTGSQAIRDKETTERIRAATRIRATQRVAPTGTGAIQAREQGDYVLSTAWRLQTRFGSAPAPCRLPLCIN